MEGEELSKLCYDSALVAQVGGILSSKLLQLLIDIDLKSLVFILEGIHLNYELIFRVMDEFLKTLITYSGFGMF